MLIALVSFLAGIIFVAYPCFYCHRYIVKRIEEDWTKIIQDRFEKIPVAYHDAFEKGWEACSNSESTIRMQYEKFFGKAA